jgi:hypothetical protein
MSQTCLACRARDLTTADEKQTLLCVACAEALGVVPMRPSRRPPSPCAKCNGMRFIRAVPRELTPSRDDAQPMAMPMGIVYQYEVQRGRYQATPLPVDAHKALGMLEVYVCRKCGFVEWYCADPEKIPVGPVYMTEELDYEGESPYRG